MEDYKMELYEAFDVIFPRLVEIETHQCKGTGFHISTLTREDGTQHSAIATANHVVKDLINCKRPIYITLAATRKKILIPFEKIGKSFNEKSDLALLVIDNEYLFFDLAPIKLMPSNQFPKIGYQVAWCGYPWIVPGKVCFFSGYISSYLNQKGDYIIDGTAINGVSGGPAFVIMEVIKGEDKKEELLVVGIITEYWANRVNGETLPGLSLARNIQPVVDKFIKDNKNFEKKAEQSK